MVSLSLALLFSAKMFVVKVAAALLRPLPWPALPALLPAQRTAPAEPPHAPSAPRPSHPLLTAVPVPYRCHSSSSAPSTP